jgi:hypothetical protein
VLDHLTDEQKPAVARKLNAAYALEGYAAARQALDGLHHELMYLNPSAARSLAEGSGANPGRSVAKIKGWGNWVFSSKGAETCHKGMVQ